MTLATLDVESLGSATLILSPIILVVVALRISPRRRWIIPLLSAPALLMGIAFTLAVLRSGAGYGGVYLVLYGPFLLLLSLAALIRGYVRATESA